MKKIIYVDIENDEVILNEINKVLTSTLEKETKAPAKEKVIKLLRAKTLDQLSVHVATKAKMKTNWGFGSGVGMPILVEFIGVAESKVNNLIDRNDSPIKYIQADDLTWTAKRNCKGVPYDEFEKVVMNDFIEEARTAAFYSALSHVSVNGR